MENETKQTNVTNQGFTKQDFEIGEHIVFNIPPGWILGGTIMGFTPNYLVVKDCSYIEGINDGHSALGSIPNANTAKELNAVVSRAYPIKDGMKLRKDAVLISIPCNRDLTPLSRKDDATAIKKAAGK